MTSSEIRQQFIEFFKGKEHAFVPSSPVVPHDDPTLMFANAGMNQFKPIFLGTEQARHPRVANTQKCIRAGGKHNDLDDVGQDTYHHTFFEMLGNWSFGDYFKKEAIEWAWELLTEIWGIPKDRLHATYFGGLRKGTEGRRDEGTRGRDQGIKGSRDQDQSRDREGVGEEIQDSGWELEPDYEARDLWRTVTDIDPSHVHPGDMKDNFWEMGDTGPCGPCSEIHIDLTPDLSGAALVNAGDARVIELWNLVFIQFNRAADGRLSPLPAKHVDTGMGFERLCAVLQGMQQDKLGGVSNYDTDVFGPIFDAIRKRTGAPEYRGTLPDRHEDAEARRHEEGRDQGIKGSRDQDGEGKDPLCPDNRQGMIDVSYRVIADHIRCLTFALTDGAIPSNEGRGYVLRRILRRAVRYGRQYMGMHEPFLADLVPTVVDHMAGAFPELSTAHGNKNIQHVRELIRDEEESFGRTFDRGLKLYQEEADYARRHHHGRIKGEAAFKLHDTYGFTIDLTERMAAEDGLTIDIGEYERLMEEAREQARAHSGDTGGDDREADEHLGLSHADMTGEIVDKLMSNPEIRNTILRGECYDDFKYDDWKQCDSYIIGVFGWGHDHDDARSFVGDVRLSTAATCFYAEQGGQVGDTGWLQTSTGEVQITSVSRTSVDATGRKLNLIRHKGKVTKGTIRSGQACRMGVWPKHRLPTMQNHSSTHMLNWALREVLCPPEEREHPHVQQKGSLVDPEKTRFDFSHNKPLSDDEIQRIDQLVNEQIKANLPVYTKEVDQQQARKINTLRAVFGEKYPDTVRVVSIGADIDKMLAEPKNPDWMKYSVEFCGGTHLKSSAEAQQFVLVSEESVAKGIRRVVGVSGEAADDAIRAGRELVNEVKALFQQSRAREEADGGRDEGKGSRDQGIEGSRTGNRQSEIGNLAERLADLQRRLNDSVIPVVVRRRLTDMLSDLQKAAKEQQKQAAAESGEQVMDRVAELLQSAEEVGGVKIVVGDVPSAPADKLRGAIDWIRNKTEASAVLLACVEAPSLDKGGAGEGQGKVTLLAGMSKAVVEKGVKAGDLIREVAPLVGGKGGGRPDMAQGGGTDPSKLNNALQCATDWLRERIGA